MSFLDVLRHPVRLANKIIRPSGLMLQRRASGLDEDLRSYMITPECAERLREELSAVAHEFIRERLSFVHGEPSPQQTRAAVDEFFELKDKRPVKKNEGGSRFHTTFWLFVVCRYLQPRLLVESGVWRGQATWFFRQACPDAEIHCFDISFDQLDYRDSATTYHESDWSKVELRAGDPLRSVAFFDDHQNQALRVRQSHERGFRLLLLDDCTPAHKLYADSWPAIPTVDMLLDERVRPGDRYEYVADGLHRSYELSEADFHDARRLVERYALFPDVSGLTRYDTHSFSGFAKLVDG